MEVKAAKELLGATPTPARPLVVETSDQPERPGVPPIGSGKVVGDLGPPSR